MPRRADVLLIDDAPDALLIQRLRKLPGVRVVRAATPDAARRLSQMTDYSFRVVMLSSHYPLPAMELALELLNPLLASGDLTGVVYGERPAPEVRDNLEDQGFTLALWRPFDEATLRFQMNRAFLRGRRMGSPRTELRAPLACRAHVAGGNRKKETQVYNLSRRGAFLETPCPSGIGAQIEVNLILADQVLPLRARVMHTNVPGNLQRVSTPLGMGVRFEDPSPHDMARLDQLIQQRQRTLLV